MPGGDGRGPGGGRAGGRGQPGGRRMGPSGTCICPKCNTTVEHAVGTPCTSIKCPKCGTFMTRG